MSLYTRFLIEQAALMALFFFLGVAVGAALV